MLFHKWILIGPQILSHLRRVNRFIEQFLRVRSKLKRFTIARNWRSPLEQKVIPLYNYRSGCCRHNPLVIRQKTYLYTLCTNRFMHPVCSVLLISYTIDVPAHGQAHNKNYTTKKWQQCSTKQTYAQAYVVFDFRSKLPLVHLWLWWPLLKRLFIHCCWCSFFVVDLYLCLSQLFALSSSTWSVDVRQP